MIAIKKASNFFTSIDDVGCQNTETEKQRETLGGKKKREL